MRGVSLPLLPKLVLCPTSLPAGPLPLRPRSSGKLAGLLQAPAAPVPAASGVPARSLSLRPGLHRAEPEADRRPLRPCPAPRSQARRVRSAAAKAERARGGERTEAAARTRGSPVLGTRQVSSPAREGCVLRGWAPRTPGCCAPGPRRSSGPSTMMRVETPQQRWGFPRGKPRKVKVEATAVASLPRAVAAYALGVKSTVFKEIFKKDFVRSFRSDRLQMGGLLRL